MYIYKLIHKSQITIKSIIFTLLRYLGLFIITIFIFVSMFLPLMTKHNITGGFKYTNYDLELTGCSGSFLESTETKKYVDTAIKGNLYGVGVIKGNENIPTQAFSINSNSLNDVFNIIPKLLFVDYDNKLINKGNSAFISYTLTSQLNIKVGDTIKISKIDKPFIVSGIFESCAAVAINASSVLILDKDNPYSEDIDFYTRAYVKLSNYEKGLEYFNDNYLNHKMLYLKHGDNWEEYATADEIAEKKKDSFTTRKLNLRRATDGYNEAYNNNELTLKALLSLIALFTTDIYTYYKHAKINAIKFTILRTYGYPKYKIFTYYFFLSLAEQGIMLAAALLFITKVPLSGSYISIALMLSWIGKFAIILILASITSGIIALYNVRDNLLLISMQEERV